MRLAALVVLLVSGCSTSSGTLPMFSQEQFDHLRFLEGRWIGTGPDGQPFYEQYAFVDPTTLESARYKDRSFSERTDSSRVELKDGAIVSSWNEFTWRVASIAPGKACFDPVDAPSAFCWERASDETVEVTQRWTDDKGEPQQYVLTLRKL